MSKIIKKEQDYSSSSMSCSISRIVNSVQTTEGLISKKKIYPEIPPRVEYRMTPQARELQNIIDELRKMDKPWEVTTLQKIKLQ
jgi:hypothetical protein